MSSPTQQDPKTILQRLEARDIDWDNFRRMGWRGAPRGLNNQNLQADLLAFACIKQPKIVPTLIDVGFSVDGLTSKNRSVLDSVLPFTKPELLNLLVSKSQQLNRIESDGGTILGNACINHMEMIKPLVLAGCDVNTPHHHYSPLMWGLGISNWILPPQKPLMNLETLEFLLVQGVDCNRFFIHPTCRGQTLSPLDVACRCRPEAIELLIDFGASPEGLNLEKRAGNGHYPEMALAMLEKILLQKNLRDAEPSIPKKLKRI